MAKKARVSPAQFVENWESGMRNSQTRYEQGISAVEDNPCEKAASPEAEKAYIAGINRGLAKRRANLLKVSLEDWQRAAKSKGATNLINSIETAKPKVAAVSGKIIQAVNDGLATIPPRGATLEDNNKRTMHMNRAMRKAFLG